MAANGSSACEFLGIYEYASQPLLRHRGNWNQDPGIMLAFLPAVFPF